MTHLLVIGLASLDQLHLSGREPIAAAGGAGLYTGLAMAVSGARVTLLAPRPKSVPSVFVAAADRFDWIGPVIDDDDLPRLEIAHHGGGRATLLHASWGGEHSLTPADLPADLGRFDIVHIAALRSALRQLDFAAACRARGARALSIGTYGRIAQGEPAIVRGLLAGSDYFFMNENEARFVLGEDDPASYAGRPGLAARATFVTRADRGAIVLAGGLAESVPAHPAVEVDPTGAGDSFCGAALVALAGGASPAEAARAGVLLAARAISAPGPSGMLESAQSA